MNFKMEVLTLKKKSLFFIFFTLILLLTACNQERIDVEQHVEENKEIIESFDESMYEGQMRMGDSNAPVKIVEFGDFECNHCKAWDGSIFKDLKKDYIDKGKAEFIFINLPVLGEESYLIAEVVEAVAAQDMDEAWKLHKEFFKNQVTSFSETSVFDFVKKHTKGLDYKKLEQDLKDKTYLKNVEDDFELAMNLGITGTPTIFINGVPIPDGHTYLYTTYKDIIDNLLKSEGETKKNEKK